MKLMLSELRECIRVIILEALDPVGKETQDINNDGEINDTDSYLLKRRKAIAASMRKRKGKQK